MKRIFALLLTFAALTFAADKKIVVRGSGYGFADNDAAMKLYQEAAGKDATVVSARSAEEFAKEIVDRSRHHWRDQQGAIPHCQESRMGAVGQRGRGSLFVLA